MMRSSEAYLHGAMAQLGSGVIAGNRHVARVLMWKITSDMVE